MKVTSIPVSRGTLSERSAGNTDFTFIPFSVWKAYDAAGFSGSPRVILYICPGSSEPDAGLTLNLLSESFVTEVAIAGVIVRYPASVPVSVGPAVSIMNEPSIGITRLSVPSAVMLTVFNSSGSPAPFPLYLPPEKTIGSGSGYSFLFLLLAMMIPPSGIEVRRRAPASMAETILALLLFLPFSGVYAAASASVFSDNPLIAPRSRSPRFFSLIFGIPLFQDKPAASDAFCEAAI